MKRTAIVGALCLAAAACGVAPRSRKRPRAQPVRLVEYVPQSVIDGFTEAGIEVNYETYACAKGDVAASPGAQPRSIKPGIPIGALVRENQLRPIDCRGANAKNIDPEHKNHARPAAEVHRAVDGRLGGDCGPLEGLDDIEGLGRLQGSTGGASSPQRSRDRELGGAHHQQGPNVSPANLEKVKPLLQQWLPLVKVYDSDSPKTALLNGDVDLGVVWSGEAAMLYNEDPKFKYVLPSEGAHQFVDSLAIPANSPNPEAAMAFMDYILRPEVSKLISADFPYTNPNIEARKLLSPDELKNPASYPPGNPKLSTFTDIGDSAVQIDKLVTDLKAQG
jgi:spermidine/putrescine transport system substrate-binding protein